MKQPPPHKVRIWTSGWEFGPGGGTWDPPKTEWPTKPSGKTTILFSLILDSEGVMWEERANASTRRKLGKIQLNRWYEFKQRDGLMFMCAKLPGDVSVGGGNLEMKRES